MCLPWWFRGDNAISGPLRVTGMEGGRPAGQMKNNSHTPQRGLFGEPREELKPKAGSGGADSRGEVREPGEGLTELPKRFWDLQNHVEIFVAALQSCQCGYGCRRKY